MPLSTDLFDYDLPPRLIAQTPAARRDGSRLLVVDRAAHTFAHRTFADLPEYLRAGDTLFRNNAAVLPARLHAQRPTGGHVECFLLRIATDLECGDASPLSQPEKAATRRRTPNDQLWRCLVRPGKKLPVGATFAEPSGAFAGTIVAKEEDGSALVRFTTPNDEPITAVANRLGEVPLPPYIERERATATGRSLLAGDEASSTPQLKPSPASRLLPSAAQRAEDLARYQTVYADRTRQVAVAAPTAGLHFTPELFATLAAQGVRTAEVTLHVGLGTFKPITTDTIEAHAIHRELYELPVATQRALFPPLTGRRIAIGTTSVRTIEHFLSRHAAPLADAPNIVSAKDALSLPTSTNADVSSEASAKEEADLFIYPPCTFRGVDALITNFHQPRSTLLCLVAAFLAPGSTEGIAWLREIYAEAIAREYRFFSYGDAMLII